MIGRPRTPADGFRDDEGEMRNQKNLDDATAEAVLRGRCPANRPELAPLAAFAEELRELACAPAPMPTGQLARLLETGLTSTRDQRVVSWNEARTAVQGSGRSKWGKSVLAGFFVAGLTKAGAASAATKSVAAVAIALTGVTGAAAADTLPTAVQDRVAATVEAVSPLDLPDSAEHRPDPRQHGAEVSADAKDPANRGVNRREVGERARAKAKPEQAGKRETVPSSRPSAPGQVGLDKANTTPAQGHAPTAAPVPTSTPSRAAQKPAAQAPERPAQGSQTPGQRPIEQPAQQSTERGTAAGQQSRP